MRTLLLIGLAGLTLAAGAADAQARARIRFGGIRLPAPVSARPVEQRPALAARRDAAGAGPTYVLLPPAGGIPDAVREAAKPAVAPTAAVAAPVAVPAPAPTPAPAKARAQAVTEAAPWCLSGRVVGTGAGFCMIN
jgi:hypothetical protein